VGVSVQGLVGFDVVVLDQVFGPEAIADALRLEGPGDLLAVQVLVEELEDIVVQGVDDCFTLKVLKDVLVLEVLEVVLVLEVLEAVLVLEVLEVVLVLEGLEGRVDALDDSVLLEVLDDIVLLEVLIDTVLLEVPDDALLLDELEGTTDMLDWILVVQDVVHSSMTSRGGQVGVQSTSRKAPSKAWRNS
jgi:hypothetical protein